MHVFLARSYRLVPAAKYHIDATLQLFAIESTFSCFCNYLCSGIASTKPLALPYIPPVPMASGKHIFMSVAVLLTSQASTSSIPRFAPYFVYFHHNFNIFSKASKCTSLDFLVQRDLLVLRVMEPKRSLPFTAPCLWIRLWSKFSLFFVFATILPVLGELAVWSRRAPSAPFCSLVREMYHIKICACAFILPPSS